MGIDALLLVERALGIVRDGEEFAIMAPTLFARQCLANWKFDIQKSHPLQISSRKAFAKIRCMAV